MIQKVDIVSRIVLRTHKPFLLLAAFFGCLIGFLLILVSIQNYYNIRYILNDKDQAIGSQFLVINKKVSILNSLDIKKSAFTEKQMNDIKSFASVKKISPFVPNQFEASAYLQLSSGSMQAELKTDLFLESVEDDFIDLKSDEWNWNQGDEIVPVILPADFINLYNFTYAPSRGLPQISKSTAGLFGFKIIINEHAEKFIFKGKIIGFSDRITSMIVPISFMNYANSKFSNLNNNKPSVFRLIVEIDPSNLSTFERFLSKKGLETNKELLKGGKFSSLLHAILYIMFFLGLFMIINAFSGFLLYLQLVITKSRYELETLLRLGYEHRRLTIWYAIAIGSLLFGILIISFTSLHFIQLNTAKLLENYGFNCPVDIHRDVFLYGIGIILILNFIIFFSIKKQIYRLSLP